MTPTHSAWTFTINKMAMRTWFHYIFYVCALGRGVATNRRLPPPLGELYQKQSKRGYPAHSAVQPSAPKEVRLGPQPRPEEIILGKTYSGIYQRIGDAYEHRQQNQIIPVPRRKTPQINSSGNATSRFVFKSPLQLSRQQQIKALSELSCKMGHSWNPRWRTFMMSVARWFGRDPYDGESEFVFLIHGFQTIKHCSLEVHLEWNQQHKALKNYHIKHGDPRNSTTVWRHTGWMRFMSSDRRGEKVSIRWRLANGHHVISDWIIMIRERFKRNPFLFYVTETVPPCFHVELQWP